MKLHLIESVYEWDVWVSLTDTTEPNKSTEAFIIATGPTKSEAMIAAALACQQAAGELLAGVVAGLAD